MMADLPLIGADAVKAQQHHERAEPGIDRLRLIGLCRHVVSLWPTEGLMRRSHRVSHAAPSAYRAKDITRYAAD
jgi:hypothetical protein